MGESTDTITLSAEPEPRSPRPDAPAVALDQLLTQHKKARGIGDAKVASLASERAGIDAYVTRSTVRNWATGSAASVNNWRQLACIASALQLPLGSADELMLAGGCDRISDLLRVASDEDERYLGFWRADSLAFAPAESAALVPASDASEGPSIVSSAPAPEFTTTEPTLHGPTAPADRSSAWRWTAVGFAALAAAAAVCLWLLIAGQASEAAAGEGTREVPTTSPVTTVDLPANGSSIRGDIVVTGTASHRGGIEHVELILKNTGESTYWNPIAGTWQDEFVRFVVPVEPGPTFAAWEYRLPVPVGSGAYRARAWARSVNGNEDPIGPMSNFNVESNVVVNLADGAGAAPDGPNQLVEPPPDDGYPLSTLDRPAPAESVGPQLIVEGTAADPDGIAYVELVIKDIDADEYWNPETNAWQAEFIRFAIDVDKPGAASTAWAYVHPDPLTPGNYRARVWATGSLGDRDEERTLSDFVVE